MKALGATKGLFLPKSHSNKKQIAIQKASEH